MTGARGASRRAVRPDVAAAALLFVVYCLSLARGVTYWDAGEFLAAIHSLGIPHPPGTPLFVLMARAWSMMASPVLGFTIAENAFSALTTAAAFGLVANIFWRATGDGIAAFAGALTAGLMSTVWLNATETEVYACALFAAFAILWCARQYALTLGARWVLLTLYACGLGWSLHLTSLLVVPAALYAFFSAREKPGARYLVFGLMLSIIGGSAVLFMLIRAQHDPAINQGDPATIGALIDVVQRHQYDVAPLWPRRAPLWLQFGNVLEYADWQVALGLGPDPGPTFARTSATVLYALLGIYGSIRHRSINRESWRTWMVLLITTSIGVVLYLNLRAGASYGAGIIPEGVPHEARDRDYFFTWAFVCWGAWSGFGVVQLARSVARRRHLPAARLRLALIAAVAIAAIPLALNWSPVHAIRHDEQQRAEQSSIAMLAAVPVNAVFLANGDNDTYPLWYLQEVLRMRRDVTIVTIPLLPPEWYRAELQRRHHLLDSNFVSAWRGSSETLANLERNAAHQGREVVKSPFIQR
ncbi:MAG TPA: DUF2723 domain-containing protein [Gemmatimonadaceae bacterium]|nr:DUF2723 domain-containing protein [Gemmatimonadaceae bacterium]